MAIAALSGTSKSARDSRLLVKLAMAAMDAGDAPITPIAAPLPRAIASSRWSERPIDCPGLRRCINNHKGRRRRKPRFASGHQHQSLQEPSLIKEIEAARGNCAQVRSQGAPIHLTAGPSESGHSGNLAEPGRAARTGGTGGHADGAAGRGCCDTFGSKPNQGKSPGFARPIRGPVPGGGAPHVQGSPSGASPKITAEGNSATAIAVRPSPRQSPLTVSAIRGAPTAAGVSERVPAPAAIADLHPAGQQGLTAALQRTGRHSAPVRRGPSQHQ